MSLACETHSAYLYDRGGQRIIGEFKPLALVRWSRIRDDISSAVVHVPGGSPDCQRELGLAEPGRHELVIFRGDVRVWEGPIHHINYRPDRVEISARDVMHYVYRTALTQEYDNRHPNIVTAITRVNQVLTTELASKEILDPPINVVPHITLHTSPGDARTSARTLPYVSSVFDHIDALAARSGLDYTVVGRAIHLFDVDTSIGRTPPVTQKDFLGDLQITKYGMELATQVVITDGLGNAGIRGGTDSYYGLWTVVHGAYDEGTTPGATELDPPTTEEMEEQADKLLSAALPTPIVVRIPDNSRLNPESALQINHLVPGVRVPLMARVLGQSLFRLQKLDEVRVEESGGGTEGEDVGEGIGEVVRVTLSPAPLAEQG